MIIFEYSSKCVTVFLNQTLFPFEVYRLVYISVGPMPLVLKTVAITKIESHPCNPIIWVRFSWGWNKHFFFRILNDWWIGGMWFVTFFFKWYPIFEDSLQSQWNSFIICLLSFWVKNIISLTLVLKTSPLRSCYCISLT